MCKIQNAQTVARSKEEATESDNISRRDATSRGESQGSGSEQERNNRAYCSRASITTTGASIVGEMLDRLMEEYSDQVARRKTLILNTEAEIEDLENRIKEFQFLKNELAEESETE